jgi:MFS family permease
MKAVTAKEPLVKKHDWSVIGLILTFALFGLVSFAGQRILSTMILQSKMDMSTYQNTLYSFNLTVGIISTAALAVCFIFAALGTSGGRRAAFFIGLISALAPVFGAVSTTLLFKVLRLPSMGAGSVIAAAVSAILIILPAFIMFLIFACSKKLEKGSRLLTLLIAILALIVAFFPVTIAVLALVVMPGNPAMAPLMQLSAYMIHVRPMMIALGLAVIYFMNRKNRTNP